MSKNTERPTAVWVKRNDALHTMECSNCGADAHYQSHIAHTVAQEFTNRRIC